MVNFKYGPLNTSQQSIRLLAVVPGETDAIIRCRLTQADLQDEPEYVALSYMWNQSSGIEYVECNGVTIPIGKNLWNFLLQYRQENNVGSRLWIDAICINQEDVNERNHQVAQMSRIYSQATSVIAWLGIAISNEALAFMPTINVLQRESFKAAMTHFLERPYWSRVWIIQEFLLAKHVDVWCGVHHANADQFQAVLKIPNGIQEALQFESNLGVRPRLRRRIGSSSSSDDRSKVDRHNSKLSTTPGWKLLQHRRLWCQPASNDSFGASFQLQALLKSFSASKCTEKHDTVYALLGIAQDANTPPHPIIPNYNKPAIEVLVDILRNQYSKGTSINSLEDQRKFLESLRLMLGITRLELARYILQRAPDRDIHTILIATGLQSIAYLQIIGTVTRWRGSVYKNNKLTPDDEAQLDALTPHASMLSTSMASDPKLSRGMHIGDMQKIIDCLTEEDLPWDVPELEANELAGYMARETTSRIMLSRTRESLTMCVNCRSRSCSCTGWRSVRNRRFVLEPHMSYQPFIGTNGLKGVIIAHGRLIKLHDMRLAVVPGSTDVRNALVLERTEENDWCILGVAHIFEHGLSEEKRWPFQSLQADPPVSQVNIQVCLSNDLLLQLRLWDILDEPQLQYLLEQSLEAETIGRHHKCKSGPEDCSALKLPDGVLNIAVTDVAARYNARFNNHSRRTALDNWVSSHRNERTEEEAVEVIRKRKSRDEDESADTRLRRRKRNM